MGWMLPDKGQMALYDAANLMQVSATQSEHVWCGSLLTGGLAGRLQCKQVASCPTDQTDY